METTHCRLPPGDLQAERASRRKRWRERHEVKTLSTEVPADFQAFRPEVTGSSNNQTRSVGNAGTTTSSDNGGCRETDLGGVTENCEINQDSGVVNGVTLSEGVRCDCDLVETGQFRDSKRKDETQILLSSDNGSLCTNETCL